MTIVYMFNVTRILLRVCTLLLHACLSYYIFTAYHSIVLITLPRECCTRIIVFYHICVCYSCIGVKWLCSICVRVSASWRVYSSINHLLFYDPPFLFYSCSFCSFIAFVCLWPFSYCFSSYSIVTRCILHVSTESWFTFIAVTLYSCTLYLPHSGLRRLTPS